MQRASNSINSFLWARWPTSTHLNKGTIALVSTLPLKYIFNWLWENTFISQIHTILHYEVVEKNVKSSWPWHLFYSDFGQYDKKFRLLTTQIWSGLGKSLGIAKKKLSGVMFEKKGLTNLYQCLIFLSIGQNSDIPQNGLLSECNDSQKNLKLPCH